MRRRLRRGAALVASVAVLGCGVPPTPASADPTGVPVPEATTGTGRVAVLDDPSIVGARPGHVEAWLPDDRADRLSVQFPLASPDCTGVHADVSETDRSVTVTLTEGRRPGALDRMCTMIVVPASVDVGLRAPLGDRIVLSTS